MSPTSTLADTMTRLSSKNGVIASLAMDRKTSTVLQSSGKISVLSALSATKKSSQTIPTTASQSLLESTSETSTATFTNTSPQSDQLNDFALMIWNHVNTTEQLVQNMDTEDEMRLLRIRTRKLELVIVPDTKYIFVVVHEVTTS